MLSLRVRAMNKNKDTKEETSVLHIGFLPERFWAGIYSG